MKTPMRILMLLIHIVFSAVFSYYFFDTLRDVIIKGEHDYWPGLLVFGGGGMYAAAAFMACMKLGKVAGESPWKY